MGGGGSGGTTQTVQKADPWSGQQPYLLDVFKKAEGLYNNNPSSYYPDSTIADRSLETNQALGLLGQRALNGSPLVDAAQGQIQDTIQGQYLNSNPYLDATFDKAAGKVSSAVNSQFNQAGRYGSGANVGILAEKLGDVATDIYGGNYAKERQNQLQASTYAPTLASQDYIDLGQLQSVGASNDAYSQAKLDDQVSRFNFNQNAPFADLARYKGLIDGSYGGTTTSTQPYFKNTASGILGGGLSGASLGSSFGPIGIPIGALAGGLLGGFL